MIHWRRVLVLLSSLALALSAIWSGPATVAGASGGFARQVPAGGSASMHAAASGEDSAFQDPEFASEAEGDAADAGGEDDEDGGTVIDRSFSGNHPARGASVNAGKKAKSNPELGVSFDGLNFRQQRLANGGNQFSVEPPDQGLCAGNGFVMESVNDVLRVFDTSGTPVTGVVDLNSFYGYAPAINRTTGVRGPFVTDPSCYYDTAVQRWFQVVLTLEVKPTAPNAGAFLGPNHIDIAVSRTADPTGSWTIYRLPVQDDGTDGTPNHHCFAQPNPPAFRTNPAACIGDYPHIGADANGFYVTTNEYDFFGSAFIGAQIYAFSKAQLAAAASTVTVVQFDTAGAVTSSRGSQPGFTVWPAESPANQFVSDAGGTEYFLSSNAADEATVPSGTAAGPRNSTELVVWALTGTSSLGSASPSLSLQNAVVPVGLYAVPPRATQKAGDFPLGQCLNDAACSTFLNGIPDPFAPEPEGRLDSNDTRMQQTWFANGKLWGALDTSLHIGGADRAGIAYYIAKPSVTGGALAVSSVESGYLGLADTDLTYPAVAVTQSGRGVLAFTLTGDTDFPSAAYASIDANVGAGPVHIAAAGLGPQDGFTEYRFFATDPNNPRPRWGDYGAAVVVGSSIWIASEYIAQTCTLAQYQATPFGSCGGTRASLGNWGSRISKVTP